MYGKLTEGNACVQFILYGYMTVYGQQNFKKKLLNFDIDCQDNENKLKQTEQGKTLSWNKLV